MMRSKNCTTSVTDPEEVVQGSHSTSSSANNNLNTIQSNENKNNAASAMYQKNDTDGSTSLSDWTDSDGDEDDQSVTQSDSEDAVDLELLRGLEEIHINVKPVAQETNNGHLISKGPQKAHKIRKQGKCQTLPYHQKVSSSGDVYNVDDRMDLVLSESLNDPGFRNNLLYTLQAQVEEYPKLMTPPLSSTDYAFSNYTSYTSSSSSSLNSNYYQQYTPESLITDSPQGSDISVEEEPASNFSSNESINDKTPRPDGALGGSLYKNPNSSYHQQYTPESVQSSPGGSDTLADDMVNQYQINESTNECSSNGRPPLFVEYARRVKSNADNFIDNVLSGIKYFLSSYRNSLQRIEYNVQVEPYTIDEDRANRLKLLAKIVQNKLTNLNEKEGKNRIKWEDQFVEHTQMSGGNVYQFL